MASDHPLIVFDLDGTLVDSAPDLVGTLNHILKDHGFRPFSIEELVPLIGAGSRALITRAFNAHQRALEPSSLDELHADFLKYYDEHLADCSSLYPGVERALDDLSEDGWIFSICTNKMEHAAKKLLEELGVASRFAAICGQDTFGAPGDPIMKPDRRAYLMTAERAGGSVERSFMVGDSRTDIDTAKAVGQKIVAVDFGYSDRPIRDYGPDVVISSFSQLREVSRKLEILRPRA